MVWRSDACGEELGGALVDEKGTFVAHLLKVLRIRRFH
jgi:hypothetical protein